jgi:hypothetical protein
MTGRAKERMAAVAALIATVFIVAVEERCAEVEDMDEVIAQRSRSDFVRS